MTPRIAHTHTGGSTFSFDDWEQWPPLPMPSGLLVASRASLSDQDGDSSSYVSSSSTDDSVRKLAAAHFERMTVIDIADELAGRLEVGTLEDNLLRFAGLAPARWEAVVDAVLGRIENRDIADGVARLAKAAARVPELGPTTWKMIALCSGGDENVDAFLQLAQAWEPGFPTEWYKLALRWSVAQNEKAVTERLLALDISLPASLPGGYSPLTLFLDHGAAELAMARAATCPIAELSKDASGRDPLDIAIASRNDDLAAAVAGRTCDAGHDVGSDSLCTALDFGLRQTAEALLDGGASLVRAGVAAKDTALMRMVAESEAFARRAVEQVVAGRGTAEQKGTTLLKECGRHFLLTRQSDAFGNLMAAGVPKNVAKHLITWSTYHNNRIAVQQCLAAGADASARALGVYDPVSYAKFRGAGAGILSDLAALTMQVNTAAEEVSARKILAHVWRIGGSTRIGKREVDLTGAFSHHFYAPMLRAIETVKAGPNVRWAEKATLSLLSGMIRRLSRQQTPAETAEAIQRGEPCLVSMGGFQHAVFGVFEGQATKYGRYHLCNKGAHSKWPVESFFFPSKAAKEQLFAEIEERKTRDLKETMDWLRAFPEQEGGALDNRYNAFLKRAWRGTEKQKIGNCSFESFLTAIQLYIIRRFAWNPACRPHSREERRGIGRAYGLFKAIRQTLMVQVLVEYLDSRAESSTRSQLDHKLIARIKRMAGHYPANWWAEHHREALAQRGVSTKGDAPATGGIQSVKGDTSDRLPSGSRRKGRRFTRQARGGDPRMMQIPFRSLLGRVDSDHTMGI